jgi:hypothetical protein
MRRLGVSRVRPPGLEAWVPEGHRHARRVYVDASQFQTRRVPRLEKPIPFRSFSVSQRPEPIAYETGGGQRE